MPNRLLREGITTSEKIDRLSAEAELFYYRLLVVVDDFGRVDARQAVLIAKCFPLRVDRVKAEHITSWLSELDSTGILIVYENPKGLFIQLLNFDKPRAKDSKCPSPNEKSSVRKHMFARENICEQPQTNVPYSYSDSDSDSDSVQHAAPSAPLVLTSPKSRKPKPAAHPDWTRARDAFQALFVAHHGTTPTWTGKTGKLLSALLKQHGGDEVIRRATRMFSPGCPDWIRRGGLDMGCLFANFDRLASDAPTPGKPAIVDENYRAIRHLAGFDADPPPEPSPPESGAYQLPPAKSEYRVRFR